MSSSSQNKIQSADELNQHYSAEDPWEYESNPHDAVRIQRFKRLIAGRRFRRALDIGCGNGFLTREIPAAEVMGIDLSTAAIEIARSKLPDPRFQFDSLSVFDAHSRTLGQFDLVVITGVLYPQYIGGAYRLIDANLRSLLCPGGRLIHCHIFEWLRYTPTLNLLSRETYQYRDYTHVLEERVAE